MPFGLRNVPSTFQRLMERVLGGVEDFAVPYIDDVLIYSPGAGEHVSHIRVVFEKLRQAELTVKPSKCLWARRSVEYLGHVVGKGRISIPDAKVLAIKNFQRPTTRAHMKIFLGLMGYCRKFIKDFVAKSSPCTTSPGLSTQGCGLNGGAGAPI